MLGLFVFSQFVPCLSDPENLLDSAILLQARNKAKTYSAHTTIGSNNNENCTGKDVWLWLGGHKEAATAHNEHLWIKQGASEFSSPAEVWYARTKDYHPKTCKKWCEAKLGKQCVRGMDDAHHQSLYAAQNIHADESRCTLWPSGHDRKTEEEAGCLQTWQTQICACGTTEVLPMGEECANDPDTDSTILFRACNVVAANPNDPYDTIQKADFLLHGEDGAPVSVIVSDAGHLLIGSDGDSIITPQFTVQGGPQAGHQIVLPPTFRFYMLPQLGPGQTLTIVNEEAFIHIPESLIITATPQAPLEFTQPPQFKVNSSGGDPVEIEMKATPNIVSDCLNAYTLKALDHKCKYQDNSRLWRRRNQTLESCYELCASTPDCKFFSYDAVSATWAGVCMGCTGETEKQGHTHFTYYKVCKRSDVRGQCEQHEEHQCKEPYVLNQTDVTTNQLVGLTGKQCRQHCQDHDSCNLFSYNGSHCQLCGEHHQFQGMGVANQWTVLGSDCSDDEITAKFG